MKTSTMVWVLIIILVVLAGGWYWWTVRAPASLPQPAPTQQQVPPPSQPGDGTGVSDNLILGIQPDATLGNYLSAYNGMTLYTYAEDSAGVSNCSGSCAQTWPPYTVVPSDRINVPLTITGAVGTTTRADGSIQVTYNGMPLYFYIQDTKPGDATGEGVGGVWYVAKP